MSRGLGTTQTALLAWMRRPYRPVTAREVAAFLRRAGRSGTAQASYRLLNRLQDRGLVHEVPREQARRIPGRRVTRYIAVPRPLPKRWTDATILEYQPELNRILEAAIHRAKTDSKTRVWLVGIQQEVERAMAERSGKRRPRRAP